MLEDLSRYGYKNEKVVTDSNGSIQGYYYESKYGNGGLYIPADLENVDSVVCCIPGCASPSPNHVSGTGAGRYGQYRELIKDIVSGNAPDYIVCINGDDSTPGLCLDVVNAAVNNGANITNTGVMDFSWSGQTGMIMGGQVSAEYPNMDVRIANIDASLLDSYNQHVYKYQNGNGDGYSDAIAANINNQVTIVSVVPDSCTWENEEHIKNQCKAMNESGHNAFMIISNANSHAKFKEEFISIGGLDWLVGKGELHGETYLSCGYYDTESGTWIESDINEFAPTYDYERLLNKNVISVDELLKVDDFEIKEYPVECLSKYEALKNIETGLSINFGTLSDTVLSSDMIYVTSAMSSLRTQIKNSNFLNGKTLGFRSSTGIPGCITGYINAYYDIMGQLMDSLVRQTESVMSVGQAIVDMNIAMEKKAEELGEAPGVIEEVGAPPTLISEEEEKEEEPPVKETPNTPPIVNPPKEDPVVPPVKETPNTPPIIPPIKEEPEPVSPPVKETPDPEPTEEPVPTKEPEVTQEPTPSEEEAILPELVVGEREDGSKILIEIREGKVTEVKYTYEYGSIEEAESALESIKEKYKELEYIKEIKVNDTNIDIIFKEESYIDLDMDSILNMYF